MDFLHKKALNLVTFKKAYCQQQRETKVSSAYHENYEHPPFMQDSRRAHTGPSSDRVGVRSANPTVTAIGGTDTNRGVMSNPMFLIGLGIAAVAAYIIMRNCCCH